jgi:hypothetical protein
MMALASTTTLRVVSAGRRTRRPAGGARAYTLTPGVWQRGYLSEQGVDLSKVQWISATEEHVEAYHNDRPPNVEYDLTANLPAMLTAGEIDAGLAVEVPNKPDVSPSSRTP